jgi:hypothetical protein
MLKLLLDFNVPPAFDLGEWWHHVVCHKVPLPHECQGKNLSAEVGQEFSDWNGIKGGNRDFLASMILCQKEKLANMLHVTIRVTLKREEIAWHLCAKGIFLFGTHCQVATYHCRKVNV